jgi:hypothetical protein
VGGGGDEGVEVAIGSLNQLSRGGILEHSHTIVLNGGRGTFLT